MAQKLCKNKVAIFYVKHPFPKPWEREKQDEVLASTNSTNSPCLMKTRSKYPEKAYR